MGKDAWSPLSKTEEGIAWAHLLTDLHFPMGQHPGQEPVPSIAYSIAHAFVEDMEVREALEDDLNRKVLVALKICTSFDGRMYVLDWQHTCYRFYPHRMHNGSSWEDWKVPVLPDGDHYVFLSETLDCCIFGDCIKQTICVFGRCLLDALQGNMPNLFTKVVRVDGRPV